MKVITVATDLHNPFFTQLLRPSCNTMGLDLVVLQTQKQPFHFIDKRPLLLEYLSTVARPDELFLFTDAYDVLFVRGPEYIEQAYRGFAKPVVFSGEPNSWPMGTVGFALYDGPPVARYPYLNSGGFIGRAKDILDLARQYPTPPRDAFDLLRQLRAHGYDTNEKFAFSDQYHWTLVQLLEPETVAIDHHGVLFENFAHSIPDLVVDEVRREGEEYHERGREAATYRKEFERIERRLREPSTAAHLHFSGHASKAVLMDLLGQGRVPDRITHALDQSSVPDRPLEIYSARDVAVSAAPLSSPEG